MNSYLITGGAGFIGSNIARELVKQGDKVRILDNFATGNRQNISDIRNDIELFEADVRDLESILRAAKGVDFVLHHAALPSVFESINDPKISHDVNVSGTLNTLIAARDAGVKRFVFAASSSAYGNNGESPKSERMFPNPLSPYAVGKITGEYYCGIFYNLYGLETVSLRYFNVFGPRQDPMSQYSAAIPKFITTIIKEDPITIYGDGEQSRDFTYVDNVINANLLACKSPNTKGEIINIACGRKISLNMLISAIEKEIGIKSKVIYTDSRLGDVKHSCANISKAQKLIGYKPIVTFDEGLKRTVKWFTDSYID